MPRKKVLEPTGLQKVMVNPGTRCDDCGEVLKGVGYQRVLQKSRVTCAGCTGGAQPHGEVAAILRAAAELPAEPEAPKKRKKKGGKA